MRHINKIVYVPELNVYVYDYTELTDNRWWDGEKRIDGNDGMLSASERWDIICVNVKYWSKEYGRSGWRGKHWVSYKG